MVRNNRERLIERAQYFKTLILDIISRNYFNPRSNYNINITDSTNAELKKYIRKVQSTLRRRGRRTNIRVEEHYGDALYHATGLLNAIPIVGQYFNLLISLWRERLSQGNDILRNTGNTNGIVKIKFNYELIIVGESTEYKTHNIRNESHFRQILEDIVNLPSIQRAYAKSFSMIVFPNVRRGLRIDLDQGGALVSSKRDLKRKVFISKKDYLLMFNLTSVRSSNNNCLIDSLRRISKFKKTAKTIRKLLNIKQGIKLSTDIIEILCKGYFTDITSLRVKKIDGNDVKVIYTYGNPTGDYQVELVLMDEHFYINDDLIIHKDVAWSKKRNDWICNRCSNKLRGKHRCPKNKLNYFRRKRKNLGIKEKMAVDNRDDFIPINTETEIIRFNIKRMIFFDIETFIEENGGIEQIPYAIGFINMADGKYQLYEGKDCMVNFVKYLLTKQNKYICAYNGSGFDFRPLVSELDKQGINIRNPIIANNAILSAKFGNWKTPNILWDICRFTLSTLKKAGESFKLKIAKGDFDHKLMKSWRDVEKYKYKQPNGVEGWKPYLKKDVLVLRDLFIVFNDKMFQEFNIYPVEYMTLSSMTYALWVRELKTNHIENGDEFSDIKMKYTEKQYNFVRLSVYGGRTYLYNMFYQCINYNEIIEVNEKFNEDWEIYVKENKIDINNDKLKKKEKHDFISKNKYGKKLKELYKKIYDENDFIYNGDVNSLYPACMVDHYYPVGDCRWSSDPKKEFENGKMGIYEVELYCSDKIKIPVLPIKEDGGLRWKTGNLKGVYNSVDITNAKRFGYEVKFINECLVWDEKRKDVFNDFIKDCYELKKLAKVDGDSVLYSISKLLMNALYGKMLQRAFRGSIEFCKSMGDFLKFEKDNYLDNWIVLNKTTMLLIGEKKDFEPCIRKPNYLGSFILAYSRRIMLDLFSELSPDLSICPFSYTDTDSLHIKGSMYKTLLDRNLIHDTKLGFCSNDIKEEGLIIKEINIAPKVYLYEYITNKGEVKTTMKCKGIPKRFLKKKYYSSDEMKELKLYGEDEKGRLKKLSIKSISQSDINKGLNPLSIIVRPMTRTFNKTEWNGGIIDKDNNKINFFHQD